MDFDLDNPLARWPIDHKIGLIFAAVLPVTDLPKASAFFRDVRAVEVEVKAAEEFDEANLDEVCKVDSSRAAKAAPEKRPISFVEQARGNCHEVLIQVQTSWWHVGIPDG